jgi:hypothetical protein
MKRKRWFPIAAVVAGIAAALLPAPALVSALSPRPTIDEEVFDRIEEGMTREEVEAIVGAPPGDYTTGPVLVGSAWGVRGPGYSDSPPGLGSWWGDDGVLEVQWASGRVCWKGFHEADRMKQTIIESLRWHFRNGWRMLFGS